MVQKIPEFYESKLDTRGRIVVRKAFRDFLGLPDGGKIEWIINDDGQAIIKTAPKEDQ
jgi:bifunctional DNA-binding transcriptional regulator/antitoxin component of YhaV-PrlF toxin-antitoxin module